MGMRIFKYPRFSRFASKEGITDGELRELVNQLEADGAGANLGGDVYKVRVARQGEGKRGGYRVIVFFRSEERTFFEYGFAKSDRDNISEKLLKAYKKAAKKYLSMTSEQLREWIELGKFI